MIWITALVLAMLPLALAVRLMWNATARPSARADAVFRWGRLRIDVMCGFLLVTVDQRPLPNAAQEEARRLQDASGQVDPSRAEALRALRQVEQLLGQASLESFAARLWSTSLLGQGTLAGRIDVPPWYRGVYVQRWLAVAVLAGCTLLLVLPASAAALATLRRRARTRRGHCAACGYNLCGSPGPLCPECGTPLPPTTTH